MNARKKHIAIGKFFVYIFCVSFSGQATTKLSEYRKIITIISVIYETFEPDIHNIFGEIIFEKLETSQTTYALINVFATQQFRSFRWLLFSLLLK